MTGSIGFRVTGACMLADYGELCTKSYNDRVYWFRVTGAIDCTIAVVIEQTGGFVLLVLKTQISSNVSTQNITSTIHYQTQDHQ